MELFDKPRTPSHSFSGANLPFAFGIKAISATAALGTQTQEPPQAKILYRVATWERFVKKNTNLVPQSVDRLDYVG
jgi:hypothetical protein